MFLRCPEWTVRCLGILTQAFTPAAQHFTETSATSLLPGYWSRTLKCRTTLAKYSHETLLCQTSHLFPGTGDATGTTPQGLGRGLAWVPPTGGDHTNGGWSAQAHYTRGVHTGSHVQPERWRHFTPGFFYRVHYSSCLEHSIGLLVSYHP